MTDEEFPTLATAEEPVVKRQWFRALVRLTDLEKIGPEGMEQHYRKEAETVGTPIPAEAYRVEIHGGFDVPADERAIDFVRWQWDWWIVEFQDHPVATLRIPD